MSKYSLAIIARNCADNLKRLLENYGQYPDEIVVVNTGIDKKEEGFLNTSAVALQFGAKVFHFPWVEDFSKARQFSFDQCTNDFVLWLDTDDTIQNPKEADAELRKCLDADVRWIFAEYLYEWAGEPMDSHCTTRLNRERVVDRHNFVWKAPIHECLCAKYEIPGHRIDNEKFRVIHHQTRGTPGEQEAKLARNLKVFETQFPDGECETRMKFYWGNTLMGLKRFDEAIKMFKRYLAESDNRHERQVAMCAISEAYRLSGKPAAAYRIAVEAIADNPQLPTPWLQASEACLAAKQYPKAVVLAEEVKLRNRFLKDEMVSNPFAVYARPWFIQAVGYTTMGRFKDAKAAADKSLEFSPNDTAILEVLDELESIRKESEQVKAFQTIVDLLPEDKLQDFASSLPEDLLSNHSVSKYVPKVRPEGKPSISIFCIPGADTWGPDSCKDGIGGSEEAVINMTRELARRGWHVEVYAKVKSNMVDEHGVHWYRNGCWTGERDNPLDVAIWWRCPDILRTLHSPARQNYLWLHDVVQKDNWAPESWNDFDKVFVLSQYHREVVEYVPDDTIVFIEHGMDMSIVVPEAECVKDPHRIIWGSDPSRGLQFLLPWWDYIRSKVPDAEIDIFYGWSPTYFVQMEARESLGVTDMREMYNLIEDLRKKPGVNWHGKVGQEELNRAFAKAAVWVYPTKWPEVYCITAIKAQAHGCVPICKDQFAMKDTVKFGVKIPEDADVGDPKIQKWVADNVIDMMLHPEKWDEERKAMMAWARQKTWGAVADQWDNLFRSHPTWKTPQTSPPLQLTA